jgi:hypothetical protein
MPASVIPPGESSDLSISFNAEGSGSRYVYVRILSGDCDESFYDFQLIGNSECGGGNAEINVQGNATDIADGDGSPDISDNTDLGTTLINSSVSQIFTIQNSGADPLSISGVSFTGIAAADFSVTTQPDAVVAPGGSTTFTVQFLPTTTGIKSAVVHVNNDDCDEGNYDFALQGKSIDYITLDLKLYLEGYYTGNSTMAATLFNLDLSQDQTATDSITVKLWSPGSLQNTNPDYTISAILHTDGTASVQFPAAVNGNSFYIAVAHRNSIETWSKDPLLMNINTAYDFSTAQNKAYDDGMNPPMVNLGDGKFAFYSGDANQDGTVDGADAIMVQDDIFQFSFGYNVTDVNGDGGTDGADAIIVQDNSFKSLYYARPY